MSNPCSWGHTLLVATENNTLYAFDDRVETQLWSKNLAAGLGQAVPNRNPPIPCGNINPIGITGTPVVGVAAGVLYAVGLIWDGTSSSSVHYGLFAADSTTAVPCSGTSRFRPPARPISIRRSRGNGGVVPISG